MNVNELFLAIAKKLPKNQETQGASAGTSSRGGVQLSNKDSERRESKSCCGGGGGGSGN